MIAADQLDAVAAAARANPDVAALRAQFPALHFTACPDDDVSPRFRPASDAGTCVLYYIAGADGHCLSMTNDPAIATGLLLAEKGDADDAP
ncbi:hypothetical protein G3580_19090 [Nitrogeniibacter mangrovi]|uniref:DUF6129 domain-containing protein n=1 Tax=Nitrogeniibacter mangrovi TaxID=2016596 RepID=A0A6C1BA23_9RHOO|nr:DUF6129 family protein [Nitrogeniibacter mangrovi]QID19538.1 hypothetical protein G3580_19090 [Nitrogeniibacter mangrovi]